MRAMDWPDDVLEERGPEIAGAVLTLLSDPLRWRHRRVETITLLSATLQRRRASVDLTVPPALHDALRLGGDQWVIPVAWLSRRQLVKFDLRDRLRDTAPLLLGAQTADVTRDLLLIAADRAAGAGAHPPGTLEVVLEAASDTRPASADALVARAKALGLGDDFVSLVRSSASGFLLLAVVPAIAGRQVIKWQTDELRPATGFVNRSGLAGLNEAASTHVELELPDFVVAPRLRALRRPDEPGAPGRRARRRAAGRRGAGGVVQRGAPAAAAGAGPGGAAPARARASSSCRARSSSSRRSLLTLVACVILIVGLVTDIGAELTAPDAGLSAIAPTVLLSAFAALSGLVLRVESHPLVRSLLGRSRAALAFTASGLVVAAAPIGLGLDATTITVCWGVAAAAALGALGVLVDDMLDHTPIGRSLRSGRSVRRVDHTV